MVKVAVLAGEGHLPEVFAKQALAKGHSVIVVDLAAEARPGLAPLSAKCYPVPLGQWQRVIDILTEEHISAVYLLGGFSKQNLFSGLALDRRLQGLLATLREKNDNAVIDLFVQDLAREGIVVKPQTELLADEFRRPGVLTDIAPSEAMWRDINYGLKIAKALAGLDIGQTVVVKDGAVLAVEAIDGTDATLGRGGSLARGGGVAIKIAKPDQDLRFDVPTVGLDTIETVIKSGLAVLALEAGKTIIVESGEVVARANRGNVSMVLVNP